MTEIKTIFGTYTYFNEIPVHSVFIWGDGLKFLKLADAIPDVGISKQPPNCFNLQKQTYCTMTAKHRVKLVKKVSDKIIEAPHTSEEPTTLRAMAKCISKLERYEKIEQIISEYKRQPSGNVFTNDKYFRRILEVFKE